MRPEPLDAVRLEIDERDGVGVDQAPADDLAHGGLLCFSVSRRLASRRSALGSKALGPKARLVNAREALPPCACACASSLLEAAR